MALRLLAPTEARAQPAWSCDRRPLVVTNATLWQPAGRLREQELLIEAGRIVALGPVGTVKRQPEQRVVDAQGQLVLPGLIDAHAHFGIPGPTPPGWNGAPFTNVLPITTRQLLRSGVTTARVHLWDQLHGPRLKANALDDCYPAPRLQLGGPALGGGVPEVDASGFKGVRGPADARAKVRAARAAGADWLAVHDLDRFAPGELAAIAEAARVEGLRLMAQGYRYREIELALEHGFRSLEYLPQEEEKPIPEPLLRRLRERGRALFLVPTAGSHARLAAFKADPGRLDDPRLHEGMPRALLDHLLPGLRNDLATSAERARMVSLVPREREHFKTLAAAGLQLAVGTDCGSPAHFQAGSLWWELETWAALGVPADKGLEAATATGAALLDLADIGALAVGRRGDFVIVKGDPDKPGLRVEDVVTVAKGGVLYVERGEWVGPPTLPY